MGDLCCHCHSEDHRASVMALIKAREAMRMNRWASTSKGKTRRWLSRITWGPLARTPRAGGAEVLEHAHDGLEGSPWSSSSGWSRGPSERRLEPFIPS